MFVNGSTATELAATDDAPAVAGGTEVVAGAVAVPETPAPRPTQKAAPTRTTSAAPAPAQIQGRAPVAPGAAPDVVGTSPGPDTDTGPGTDAFPMTEAWP